MRFPLYSNLTIVNSPRFGVLVLRPRDLSSDDLSDMSDVSPIGLAVSMTKIQNESLPKIGIENETVRFLLSKKELKSARALSSCQGYLKIVGDDDNYPFFVFGGF